MKRISFICIFSYAVLFLSGQNRTITQKETREREAPSKHRVMIIPFEPKLYMGEIDRNINSETELSSRQIRNQFRDGLNHQLYKAFRVQKYNVVDLMSDTVKYRKDLEGIYQYLVYEYQKVPDPEKYSPPGKEEKSQTIEKGQLNIETRGDSRFMNARLTNSKVVPLLYGKYKTDVFVFINELDILASGYKENYDPGPGASKRKIVVHYTVYTYDAKEISSGIVVDEFDVNLNVPGKIIERHFSRIAATIVQRVNKGLTVAN